MTGGAAAVSQAPAEREGLRSRTQRFAARHPLASILLAGLIVRLMLTPLYAHLPNGLTDEGFWKHWMEAIDRDGVLNIFRSTDTDYVGYHWVLWLLTLVYDAMGGRYGGSNPPLHILVKLPSVAFDLALIATVYHGTRVLLRQHLEAPRVERGALAAAAIIAFQPAVLYDGAVWAQTDSAITAAMLGALVLALCNRPFAAGGAFALGLAVKPHPIIIAPVLAILLWRAGGTRALVLAGAAAAAVAMVVLGPWVLHGELGRIAGVYELLFTKERDRLSELAWNAWWIFDQRGDPLPSSTVSDHLPLSFRRLALLLSLAAGTLAVVFTWLKPGLRHALVAAAYLAFAFHALPIGSHERYLYPFLALLLPVAVLEARWRWLYAAVSTTFFLNLFVVAPPVRPWMDIWVYGDFGVAVAAVNVALFAAFSALLVGGMMPNLRARLLTTSARTGDSAP